MYGHLNNAVYYELFDSAINGWLITGAGSTSWPCPTLGVVAESGCRYFRELEYPRPLDVGVRVERLGRSSITYALGLFDAGAVELAALGRWVHVYIDRTSRTHGADPPSVREPLGAPSGPAVVRTAGASQQAGSAAVVSPRHGTMPRPSAATCRT